MDLKLNDKNAIVCGSTSGIGQATAQVLASEGATITLIARNEDKLKKVLASLPGDVKHTYLVADFTNPEEVKGAVERFIEKNHGFHILVNNTGGPAGGPAHQADLEEYSNAFTQHLQANHVLMQACIPFMKEAGYGRIINVISTSVKQPLDGLGVSNTIRGAVANWSKTLANELGQYGITVNNVLPGATSTGRLTEIIGNKAAKTGLKEAEITEKMVSTIPVGRFALPEEIALAIAFLSSAGAAYINGINLPVDGGRTKSL